MPVCVEAYNQYSRSIVLSAGFGDLIMRPCSYLSGAVCVASKNNALDDGGVDVASGYFAGSLWFVETCVSQRRRKICMCFGLQDPPTESSEEAFFALPSQVRMFSLDCSVGRHSSDKPVKVLPMGPHQEQSTSSAKKFLANYNQ
jgi:hypothetical protein